MENYLAIDNVCAWPNLTPLPNGDMIATIFNQPCHGKWEGDIECWSSSDNGNTWQRRGVAAPHEPQTNRQHVAAGQAVNGDLLVITSGWSFKSESGKNKDIPARDDIVNPWVCRSEDSGKTWHQVGEINFDDTGAVIPFGDIVTGADGNLHATVYTRGECNVLFMTSYDDGNTWKNYTPLAADGRHNETDILHLGDGKWLAACRAAGQRNLDLFVSDDDGATWRFDRILTGPDMHPSHLMQLQDGQILLSFGIRFRHFRGIGVRLGEAQGDSWGKVAVITHLEGAGDIGYPSSAQRDDGSIVTAWYANGTTMHSRYHMGVTMWSPDEL